MAGITASRRVGGRLARTLLGLPLAAALGWEIYRQLFVPRTLPLPPALSGERREFHGRAGRLSYYVAGEGAPMLLVHSVNAAASAYEVRPLYEHYRTSRRVYALDLPGFGFSERSDREYSPRLYTDAILDMLGEIEQTSGPQAVDALAVSLGSEFLARAASERPDRFGSVTLVTPTGFRKEDELYGPPEATRKVPGLREVFSFPLWGRSFFDLLNSRESARYFLKQTFGSYEAIDQGLLEYDYLTSHQQGAEHAPFYFISGALFSRDIGRVYEALDMPVWVPHGTKGQFADFSNKGALEQRLNWSFQPFDTGALPYFERPDAFIAAYDRFLQRSLMVQ